MFSGVTPSEQAPMLAIFSGAGNIAAGSRGPEISLSGVRQNLLA